MKTNIELTDYEKESLNKLTQSIIHGRWSKDGLVHLIELCGNFSNKESFFKHVGHTYYKGRMRSTTARCWTYYYFYDLAGEDPKHKGEGYLKKYVGRWFPDNWYYVTTAIKDHLKKEEAIAHRTYLSERTKSKNICIPDCFN